MWSRAEGVDAKVGQLSNFVAGPQVSATLNHSAFASLCTLNEGYCTLCVWVASVRSPTLIVISLADMPAGFPHSALQGECHVSVMSMASTINVAARRNTVSAIKVRAVNDPLPVVSVADRGVRIAGAPARAATAPKVESR